MTTKIQYKPQGVCSNHMEITLNEQGVIEDVIINGGCNGNLKGISALVRGMDAQAVIARMEGIACGPRATSCPDQLAKALRQALQAQKT